MGKRKCRSQVVSSLTKKQKKHLKEFGEEHPFYDKVSERAEAIQLVELTESSDQSSSDSDSDSQPEQVSSYQKLLFTLKAVSDAEDEDEACDEEGSEDENADDGLEEAESEVLGMKRSDQEDDGDQENEMMEEFTDTKYESEFSLEANFEGNEASVDSEEKEIGAINSTEDPFKQHMDTELSEEDVKNMMSKQKSTTPLKWQTLGQLVYSSTLQKCSSVKVLKDIDMKQLHLYKPLEVTWPRVNKLFLTAEHKQNTCIFTALQKEIFGIMNSYKDLYFPERTALGNGEEVRSIYCLHAINHVLKANSQVLVNNAKLRDNKARIDDDDFRDQGLTRPKVLIVVPFREAALRVVQIFIDLLEVGQKKLDVSNKKRFKEEYSATPEDRPPNLKRPEDHEAIFAGNFDDHFRIGVAILQKSMRLYAPFYSSDIIIASPLGLRTVIGVEGDKKRDLDFLSSIEILIIDQADIFLMQNWEHVVHLMKHLNLQPLDSHGVDFSRVRMWSLNNWSKYYRQTLLFSAFQEPQINSIHNKHCLNYRGQVAVKNMPQSGSICQVVVQLPHVFQRLETESFITLPDARFHFLINKILPQYRDAVMSHTLIYIPSYFDFVRLRNYFKKEELNFTHICEYTKRSGISRARQFFFKGQRQFLLFTERFHFYKRYMIKGIKNLIFYELPTYPHFYSEVCNMVKESNSGEEATWTCTVLYSKYDAQKLALVVGADRAAQMLQSKKSVHLFVTGEV
ncbi:U3 small nucleolar RNA-associated protein 25 homolog [Latimeria chalumnae]|uniref:U3 small nucleolar RNA-associated protein 25 homolog n=1 Tax=Latimeria chalumnae TaxID=7897 RepID=H3AFQ5_LATCH|nr:PREDICTED: digestive organ expansion factor homolog [Latimeria chalumnae]|eukprot:XP_005997442.1 PREDICTED: digestive organ expansion factor homolog [Latimeria chalumnae]